VRSDRKVEEVKECIPACAKFAIVPLRLGSERPVMKAIWAHAYKHSLWRQSEHMRTNTVCEGNLSTCVQTQFVKAIWAHAYEHSLWRQSEHMHTNTVCEGNLSTCIQTQFVRAFCTCTHAQLIRLYLLPSHGARCARLTITELPHTGRWLYMLRNCSI